MFDVIATKVRITEMVTVKSIFMARLLSFINTILCYSKKYKEVKFQNGVFIRFQAKARLERFF